MIDVEATERLPRLGAARASRVAAVTAVLRRHAVLVALLAAGFLLRAVAEYAIYPGIWFSDTNSYVATAATGTLSPNRVGGYSLFLAPFWHLGSAAALIIVQHLIGLALIVLVYALLRRRGVSLLLSILAVVPLALDAYLVQIEHTIMSETIFHICLVGAFALLLWNDRPGFVAVGGAGLLLGYVTVVRSVSLPLIGVFLLYLLIRKVGWRRLVVFGVGWLVVTGAYATIYHSQYGKFGFTQSDGKFLYAKVAPFADCKKLGGLPADERRLCPDPKHRLSTNAYMWGRTSPIRHLPPSADKGIRDFAVRVVRAQPLTYARVVTLDFLHYFEPGKRVGPNDPSLGPWEFPFDPTRWGYPGYRGPIRPQAKRTTRVIFPNKYIGHMTGEPTLHGGASRLLRYYQRVMFTSGQLLALCVLVVLAGLLMRRGAWRLRLDAAFLAASVLVLLLFATALSVFSYRYGLIAVVLLPAAAALAGTALLERRRDVVA